MSNELLKRCTRRINFSWVLFIRSSVFRCSIRLVGPWPHRAEFKELSRCTLGRRRRRVPPGESHSSVWMLYVYAPCSLHDSRSYRIAESSLLCLCFIRSLSLFLTHTHTHTHRDAHSVDLSCSRLRELLKSSKVGATRTLQEHTASTKYVSSGRLARDPGTSPCCKPTGPGLVSE